MSGVSQLYTSQHNVLQTLVKTYAIYVCVCVSMYIYMLGTDVKPQARFKAVRTVLKPSGRL